MDTQPSPGHQPHPYQPVLDKLIAYGSAEPKKPELVSAKAEYFKLTGEVFEDDKMFEMRMASFLDWFLFDRPSPTTGKTPAQEFLDVQGVGSSPDELMVMKAFTRTRHALFEVRKLTRGFVKLKDLYTDEDRDVTERRHPAGLEKGDIIEARLIPVGEYLLFSSAFCYHSREASKLIIKEIKRRKKKEAERPEEEMTWDCARRAVKAERYRQIAVEKIYDFETTPI